MLILFHDKIKERHEKFLEELIHVPGKHVIIHVNNAKEALEALTAYDFELISIDDTEGDAIITGILAMPLIDRPSLVNIHSYAWMLVKQMEDRLKPHIEVWTYQLYNKNFYEEILEKDEKILAELENAE